MKQEFDVAIIGGGISGSAAFYTLSEYTDVESVAIIDKCSGFAKISSSAKSNSQTIHDGSIETNYTAEKAAKVKFSAQKVKNYALKHKLENRAIFKYQKMAIGVGDLECEYIKKRFADFESIFPGIEFFDKAQLKEIEPKIIEGENGQDRAENVVGMGYKESWCGLNYEFLSDHFVQLGMEKNKKNATFLNFWVKDIHPEGDGYKIVSRNGDFIYAKFILVNAGSFSLPLAQKMGYGLDLGCLPVAGSFYFIPNLLRGKVYTVQNPKLPFAAIHGDPDVVVKNKTRIGPTAIAMPKLERGKNWLDNISWDLIKIDANADVLKIVYELFKDHDIRSYVFKNFEFELPFIGKRKFLEDARKIIPSLDLSHLQYAHGYGEVRPQVLDRKEKKLILGEKKILTNKGITFNMTPSPGATSCLENALRDTKEIVAYLNKNFDTERFYKDLSPDEI